MKKIFVILPFIAFSFQAMDIWDSSGNERENPVYHSEEKGEGTALKEFQEPEGSSSFREQERKEGNGSNPKEVIELRDLTLGDVSEGNYGDVYFGGSESEDEESGYESAPRVNSPTLQSSERTEMMYHLYPLFCSLQDYEWTSSNEKAQLFLLWLQEHKNEVSTGRRSLPRSEVDGLVTSNQEEVEKFYEKHNLSNPPLLSTPGALCVTTSLLFQRKWLDEEGCSVIKTSPVAELYNKHGLLWQPQVSHLHINDNESIAVIPLESDCSLILTNSLALQNSQTELLEAAIELTKRTLPRSPISINGLIFPRVQHTVDVTLEELDGITNTKGGKLSSPLLHTRLTINEQSVSAHSHGQAMIQYRESIKMFLPESLEETGYTVFNKEPLTAIIMGSSSLPLIASQSNRDQWLD